jgi:hypothetical protein
MTEPTFRRFPAPWAVIELPDCFQIEDAKGFPLSNMAAVPELRDELRDRDKRL